MTNLKPGRAVPGSAVLNRAEPGSAVQNRVEPGSKSFLILGVVDFPDCTIHFIIFFMFGYDLAYSVPEPLWT